MKVRHSGIHCAVNDCPDCRLMCIKTSSPRAVERVREAFTLVEIMVAAGLMTLMFLGLFGGISFGFSLTQAARENLRATQIILERMEGIRIYNFDQLVSSNMFPTTFTAPYYPLGGNNAQGPTYYGSFALSNPGIGAGYNSNIRLVTVTVAWTNGFGTTRIAHRRQMQSIVARWGIQNYSYF